MKSILIYLITAFTLMFFTSVTPSDDLKIDWQRITDKDYIVTYVRVQYDSSSQYAIDTKVRMYSIDEAIKIFSKTQVKIIRELLLDETNYSTNPVDDICKTYHFPYAIVVTRHHEVEGIINLGCQNNVWLLEPKTKSGELLILNEKGLKLKEKIFN